MNHIVERQRAYFLAGNTLPLRERKMNLRKLRTLLQANEKMLAEAIYRDYKKSYYFTIENELTIPYGELNRTLQRLRRWSAPKRYRTNLINFPASSRSIPVPFGVTLVIGPWNYPYMLNLVPVISALAAGNTVILKPSELTSHCSRALSELINNNFPSELLYVVEGGAEETQQLLQQKFDKIFFTGSSRVGKIIMRAAAEKLTPVTLELGGKNPVIVLPDCNLKVAARRIMWGKMHNNGQACVSPDYVYVHREISERFLNEMKRVAENIHHGKPEECALLPAIINEQSFDRLKGYLDTGKVFYGGQHSREDLFMAPTILTDVRETDPVMKEEVFGPVLPVLEFDELDRILLSIINRPRPLMFYLFTGNMKLARRLVREIPSGGTMINETVLQFINMNTPFGGSGDSGMGSYHGRAGFDNFSHYKTVLNKPFWFELFLKYPPYKPGRLKIIRIFLGRSFRNLKV